MEASWPPELHILPKGAVATPKSVTRLREHQMTSSLLQFQKFIRSAIRSWRGPPSGLLLPPPPVVLVTVIKPPRVLIEPSLFRRRLETLPPGLEKCGVLVKLKASARNFIFSRSPARNTLAMPRSAFTVAGPLRM